MFLIVTSATTNVPLAFVGAIDGPTDFIVSTELTVTSRSPFFTVSPILWVLFVSLELFPPRLPVILLDAFCLSSSLLDFSLSSESVSALEVVAGVVAEAS
ncbi:Uncharacterised protein [Staphylococcus aureus]|nr:Uncharacterised protein [Staphylococcus aureus]